MKFFLTAIILLSHVNSKERDIFFARPIFKIELTMSVRELELCGRLAYAAAANQDSLVRTAVVKVLFNRARGGSIEKELYKQNQFYEVESPMFNVSLKDEVFRECLKAAEAAPKSNVIPDDFIYFMNIGCKSERMKRILSQNPKAIYLGDLVFF